MLYLTDLINLYHSNSMFHGAVIGLAAAISVDVHAFVNSNGWTIAGWSLSVASKRWVTGIITGAGLNGMIG